MRKCVNISPYMRRLLVIYDFATAPFWISLHMKKVGFSFLSVYLVQYSIVCFCWDVHRLLLLLRCYTWAVVYHASAFNCCPVMCICEICWIFCGVCEKHGIRKSKENHTFLLSFKVCSTTPLSAVHSHNNYLPLHSLSLSYLCLY